MAPEIIDLASIKPDSLYRPTEVAVVLGKTEKTLANLRCRRKGPAWHRVGGAPYYRGSDLLEYIEGSRIPEGGKAPMPKAARPKRRRA